MSDNIAVLQGYTVEAVAHSVTEPYSTKYILLNPHTPFHGLINVWDCDEQAFTVLDLQDYFFALNSEQEPAP